MKTTPTIFLALTLGIFSTPNGSAEDVAAVPQVRFNAHEIILGTTARQTVLSGFLLGGEVADLCVIHVDENSDRQLEIFSFDSGAWVSKLKTKLRPGVLFADIARFGDRERLLTSERDRLNWFNPKTGSEEKLVTAKTSFVPPRNNEILHVDISKDLNADGRDDLVIPAEKGFQIFAQLGDGRFAESVSVGLPPKLDRILGADGYRYKPWSQSRIHLADFDQDGRNDLMFWNGNRFEVHFQNKRGQFASTAKTFPCRVAFDSTDPDSLSTGGQTGTVLHSLADLNSDSVADLVLHSIEGKRISKKRSMYKVHLGSPTENGLSFESDARITFHTKGHIQLGLSRQDFDGDGQADVMITTIQNRFLTSSLWKRLKGLMGDDLWLELQFYRGHEGQFTTTPNSTARLALIGAPTHQEPGWVPLDIVLNGASHKKRGTQKGWQRAFNTNLLIGDVTGEGRADLLNEKSFRGLSVNVGVPGPSLFAGQSQSVRHIVPHDEEYTWLTDLNRDGKQDIIMHHPFTTRDIHGGRIPTEKPDAHRLTLLIAK